MRILLVGDYSGLHKNLKEGLLELGHDVKLISDGNAWKNVGGADYPLFCNYQGNNKLAKLYKGMISPFNGFINKNYCNYDIVQLTDNLYAYPEKIRFLLCKMFVLNNRKTYMCACGDNTLVYKAYRNGAYRYFVYDDNEAACQQLSNKNLIKIEKKIEECVNGIIPISFEYSQAYKFSKKVCNAIPIGINYSNIKYKENVVNGKLVIYHGINDIIGKGTNIIKEAMLIFEKKHHNEVKVIIGERLPLHKYLEVISDVNIVIDQCKGYSMGLNALICMALGKVVLGGAEPEGLQAIGIKDTPCIDILPNVDDIIQKLEILLEEKKSITQLGFLSRQYVIQNHNYIDIAQRYVDTWNN